MDKFCKDGMDGWDRRKMPTLIHRDSQLRQTSEKRFSTARSTKRERNAPVGSEMGWNNACGDGRKMRACATRKTHTRFGPIGTRLKAGNGETLASCIACTKTRAG